MEYPRQTNNLIATLRGLPEDHSVARQRPAYTLGSLIEVLEEKYKIGQARVEDLIAQNWKQIIGEKHAHSCSPQKIVAGAILRIRVANPTLRCELEFEKRNILNRIHRLPGCGIIQQINMSSD